MLLYRQFMTDGVFLRELVTDSASDLTSKVAGKSGMSFIHFHVSPGADLSSSLIGHLDRSFCLVAAVSAFGLDSFGLFASRATSFANLYVFHLLFTLSFTSTRGGTMPVLPHAHILHGCCCNRTAMCVYSCLLSRTVCAPILLFPMVSPISPLL